jgi:hypothetical protein
VRGNWTKGRRDRGAEGSERAGSAGTSEQAVAPVACRPLPSPPVPTAVISDIHGNAEALKRVLRTSKRARSSASCASATSSATAPSPSTCVDLVRERCAWSLMGNHDFGVLYEPTNFNAGGVRPRSGPASSSTRSPTRPPRRSATSSSAACASASWTTSPTRARSPCSSSTARPAAPSTSTSSPTTRLNAPEKIQGRSSTRVERCRDGRAHARARRLHRRARFLPADSNWARGVYRFQRQREGDHQRRLRGPAARPGPAGELRHPPRRPTRTPQPSSSSVWTTT